MKSSIKDAIRPLLDVLMGSVMDYLLLEEDSADARSRLMIKCQVCLRSADLLDDLDRAASNAVREVVACLKTDYHFGEKEYVECINEAKIGLSISSPTESTYYSFLILIARCHICLDQPSHACDLLASGLHQITESSAHINNAIDISHVVKTLPIEMIKSSESLLNGYLLLPFAKADTEVRKRWSENPRLLIDEFEKDIHRQKK